ncbi:MAG TPA: hypothetical protein VFN67_40265 [Polyangiales bacterium]|nr:hypothetical protein [Polyangiales bacterium]
MPAVWIIATACADDTTAPATSEKEESPATEAGPTEAKQKPTDTRTWMTPTEFTCTPSQPQSGKPLTLIPAGPPEGPGVAIFRQVDAECPWHEPAQVVLYNGSDADVEITGLGLDDPHFAVAAIDLPHTLAAGDILPLQLDFNTEVGSFTAKLSVASSDGCAQFTVRAKGVEPSTSGVIVHEPYVVNVGHVAAGTLSDPVEVVVLDQLETGGAKSTIGDFRSTNPSFRIDPPAKSTSADACETTKISIRLMAPSKPGIVRGQLSWTFEGPENAAITATELVGVVD